MKLKRITALLLSMAVMVGTLAGCGGSNSDGGGAQTSQKENTADKEADTAGAEDTGSGEAEQLNFGTIRWQMWSRPHWTL